MFWSLAACIENDLLKSVPTAEGAAPDIVVTPSALDFGQVPEGDVGYAALVVANDGGATLTLDPPAFGSSDLVLSAAPLSLEPGEQAEVDLAWTARAPLADVVRFGSNDPDQPVVDVPVTGALPAPDLVVTPPQHSFGELALGLSATTAFHVENVGEGPLHVSDVAWTATDADLAAIDLGGLPGTLAPGASTDLVVRYAPHAYGVDLGSFQLTSDDPDSPVVSVSADGTSTDPCAGYTQAVELSLTADDAWEGYLDGVSFTAAGAGSWSTLDTVGWDLGCGPHTLALYATDQAFAVSGVIAVVKVNGVTTFVSGVDHWSITDSEPPADWTDVWFDDSAWKAPELCSDTSLWGAAPDPLYADGASWIWWTPACSSLGQAWLRLDFTVP